MYVYCECVCVVHVDFFSLDYSICGGGGGGAVKWIGSRVDKWLQRVCLQGSVRIWLVSWTPHVVNEYRIAISRISIVLTNLSMFFSFRSFLPVFLNLSIYRTLSFTFFRQSWLQNITLLNIIFSLLIWWFVCDSWCGGMCSAIDESYMDAIHSTRLKNSYNNNDYNNERMEWKARATIRKPSKTQIIQ